MTDPRHTRLATAGRILVETLAVVPACPVHRQAGMALEAAGHCAACLLELGPAVDLWRSTMRILYGDPSVPPPRGILSARAVETKG